MAKDDLPQSVKDQIKHYEEATYSGDPEELKPGMGHNEIIWLRNECKRLVKERDEEHKLRQEAEGELTIVKGISVHMSPEMRNATTKIEEMRKELDRIKLDNNNLYTRVADALEVNESHQKLNGRLRERVTELEQENIELHADNKKISKQVEDQLDRFRRAGGL